MTWFKVDDSFHSHPKTMATELAALGLWVVAGSWSGANLTDGFIPDHVILRLSAGQAGLADALVSTGLWKRTKGGYRFHEWAEFQPSKSSVLEQREAWRKAKADQRKVKPRKPRSTGKVSNEDTTQDSYEDTGGTLGGVKPSRPVPSSSNEEEPPVGETTARVILAEYLERCAKRPPATVIGQLGKHVKAMLEEGIDPDDIRRGLSAWMAKRLNPSTLPSVVNEVMNHIPARASPTTNGTDANIAALLGRRTGTDAQILQLPRGES